MSGHPPRQQIPRSSGRTLPYRAGYPPCWWCARWLCQSSGRSTSPFLPAKENPAAFNVADAGTCCATQTQAPHISMSRPARPIMG